MGMSEPTVAPVFRPSEPSSERPARTVPGAPVAVALLVALAGAIVLFAFAGAAGAVAGVIVAIAVAVCAAGLIVVAPNQASVLILLGRYTGTVDRPGFHWVNPLTFPSRRQLSLRVRNFQTDILKVNDAGGSPIDIAAVVVWRVTDTARTVFDVDDFERFVVVQSEAAVRHLASQYPYDDFEEGVPSLRGNADEVNGSLHEELQARLEVAGLEILEARLTHLAYAPEIAAAMLRRQQASAIVAARRTIVSGAVGLVDMALRQMGEQGVVELDEERKAAMVSNLMVVLVGDHGASPIVNAGSPYQ
jgi:regulator of protease activity HflC (stomatin/prohibitin superfamily)